MSLIKSISGIRGTIGGAPGEGLSPVDVVKFTAAYAHFISKTTTRTNRTIVVGRDARLSGPMVNSLVEATLTGMGFDVVNIGLCLDPHYRGSRSNGKGMRRYHHHRFPQS